MAVRRQDVGSPPRAVRRSRVHLTHHCARCARTDAGRSIRRISRRAASVTSASVGSWRTGAPSATGAAFISTAGLRSPPGPVHTSGSRRGNAGPLDLAHGWHVSRDQQRVPTLNVRARCPSSRAWFPAARGRRAVGRSRIQAARCGRTMVVRPGIGVRAPRPDRQGLRIAATALEESVGLRRSYRA